MTILFIYYKLKVQSCKLYSNKYMIVLTQITNTKIFAFISVLVLKLLNRKVLFTNRKRQYKLLKRRLLFKKIANFTGQLLQNYKWLECKIFRILLKQAGDHLSALFQFAWLYFFNLHDGTFKLNFWNVSKESLLCIL